MGNGEDEAGKEDQPDTQGDGPTTHPQQSEQDADLNGDGQSATDAPDTSSNDTQSPTGDSNQGSDSQQGGQDADIDLDRQSVVNAAAKPPVDLDHGIAPLTLPVPVKEDAPNFTDHARRNIAYWLLGLLSGIIVLAFLLLLWALASGQGHAKENFEYISGLLNIVFGPVATLVGSAVGFYFGAQSAKPPQGGGAS